MRLFLLLAGAMFIVGCKPAVKPISEERRALHVQSFDQVWTTIQDQHWDPNLNGVDWNAARDELRPKVESAKTDADARNAMNALIGKLKQSHFGIIPAETYAKLDDLPSRSADDAKPGFTGMTLRAFEDQAIVTRVEPNSAAAKAGVQLGWIVTRIGKFDIAKVRKNVQAAYAKSGLVLGYESITLNHLLEGDEGKSLEVEFRDGNDAVVTKSIVLAPPSGAPTKFMNLPTFFITTDFRRLESDIGYAWFTAWFDPQNVSIKFKDFVEANRDIGGLILDLRGNPGGIGFMANGMAGYLVDQPNLKLGEMTMRKSKLAFAINPQPYVFTGPVAILVDEASMSTSEIMAGGMQDIGRARVFGIPTIGAALPSRVDKLPNGDGFQYAFANYVSAKGQVLEGKGVQPDEVVQLNRKSLLSGKDDTVDAAIRWIRSQKK